MTFSEEEHNEVRGLFPSLVPETFKITSPRTTDYNCIAWAAEDADNWWWPDGMNYWPDGLLLDDSIENFVKAFALLGYEQCTTSALEEGYEKVAIYAVGSRTKHMARQLDDGFWTSKLGPQFDVRHGEPGDVDGMYYGKSEVFLRRPKKEQSENDGDPDSKVHGEAAPGGAEETGHALNNDTRQP